MKNKFKLILLMVLAMAVVVGCSMKKPSTVVEEYFRELKKGSKVDLTEYVIDTDENTEEQKKEDESEDPTIDEAMNLYLSKMDVKVLSENVEEDKATVEVELTGLNLANIFLEMLGESFGNIFTGKEMSDTDMSKSMLEKVKNGDVETRTGKINLTKVDKVWKLNVDDDYNALIFGNADMTEDKIN